MPGKKMDADWVHKVKTKIAQEDWYDTASPIGVSLVLRVSRTGRKVWYARYRPRGEKNMKRFKLGEYDAMSLADARARVSAIHAGQADGGDPAAERKRAKEAPTFKEIAKQYLEIHAERKKRSWEEDKRILEKDLLPAWSDRKAHEVKKRDVIALLDSIVDRGAPIQANRTLALARKVYNFGIERDLCENNPCLQVKAPSPETQRDRVLIDDEIKAVWAACGEVRGPTGTMLRLRLLTAQRGGEVEKMRWADLDLEAGWWTIPAEHAKNKLSHRVPLAPMATGILKERRQQLEEKIAKGKAEDSEWVFPNPANTGPIAEIKTAVGSIRKKSGLEWVPHDLRRTAASHMASMGIQRLVISKILNHVETGVTAIYDRHGYDQEKRQALDAWAERLSLIVAINH